MKRISARVRQKARKIKLLLLDVDGVLTDGGILLDDAGREIKRFNVRDGHGIVLLRRFGIEVGLITGRFSKTVTRRAKELGIRIVHQKAHKKVDVYREIKRKTGLEDGDIAYVGDDIVDLPVLQQVGLACAVKDSWEGLRRNVDYVTSVEGGQGAVREIAELLLRVQGKWREANRGDAVG